MKLLVFNHYSIDNANTIENVNDYFLNLSQGIREYMSKSKNKQGRFFTEIEDFKNYKIANDYTIIDAVKYLKRDLQSFMFELITMRCNSDCLSKLDSNELDKIVDYEIFFKDESLGKDYILLAFVIEKNGILLSFDQNRWMKSSIEVLKYKDNKAEVVFLDNIANKLHVQEFINNDIINKLPTDNISYSKIFKEWLVNNIDIKKSISKIIDKLNESLEQNFDIDMELIKPLKDNIFEIRVGSVGGLQKSQIRILFRFQENKKYILFGLVKQGSNSYDYTNDIKVSNEIFEKLIKENHV